MSLSLFCFSLHVCICLAVFEESGFKYFEHNIFFIFFFILVRLLFKSSDRFFSELLKNHFFFSCPTSVWIALKWFSPQGFKKKRRRKKLILSMFCLLPKDLHRSSHLNYNQSRSQGGAGIEVQVVSPSLFPTGGGEDHPSYRLLSGAKEMLRRVIEWL